MKKTSILLLLFFNTIVMTGQVAKNDNHATAVSNSKYSFAESYSDNYYSTSITFRNNNKEQIRTILNYYFNNPTVIKNLITWKELKSELNNEGVFYVELKNKELKIKWNSNEKGSHQVQIDKLRKISKEIIDTIK